MSEKFRGVERQGENFLFNPKKLNLPYTIFIIKPGTCVNWTICQDILAVIEGQGFEIRSVANRELTRQEAENIYYKHAGKDYFNKLVAYATTGESLTVLLSHPTTDPISLMKKLLGNRDPEVAKKTEPDSLRAKYGKDIFRNEFYSSDDQLGANKDRDIFRFPIPQSEPLFKIDRQRISFSSLWSFLHPKNMEHSDVNGRLDVFAVYGPVSKRFPISWFSKQGQIAIKRYLRVFRAEKIDKEKDRLGLKEAEKLNSEANLTSTKKLRTTGKIKIDHRLHLPPNVIVDEETITTIWSELTAEDQSMCEDFCTLLAGRELTHVVTDKEVESMVKEMNRKDLLAVLMGAKGNGAKVMMEEMSVQEPQEFQHSQLTLRKLLAPLETDYYGRYEFRALQNAILEDRRIRLNVWAAQILQIPVEKIKLNKHLNPAASTASRRDPRSLDYTLSRTQPLPLITKKRNIAETPLDFPISIVDKKKYMPNEEALVRNKLLHRHAFKFTPLDEQKHIPSETVYLMRNLNEGRNADWNNYATLKGNAVGSYIKYKSRFDHK